MRMSNARIVESHFSTLICIETDVVYQGLFHAASAVNYIVMWTGALQYFCTAFELAAIDSGSEGTAVCTMLGASASQRGYIGK